MQCVACIRSKTIHSLASGRVAHSFISCCNLCKILKAIIRFIAERISIRIIWSKPSMRWLNVNNVPQILVTNLTNTRPIWMLLTKMLSTRDGLSDSTILVGSVILVRRWFSGIRLKNFVTFWSLSYFERSQMKSTVIAMILFFSFFNLLSVLVRLSMNLEGVGTQLQQWCRDYCFLWFQSRSFQVPLYLPLNSRSGLGVWSRSRTDVFRFRENLYY